MFFESTELAPGDSQHDILGKILARLNLNAAASSDVPSSNVAVTNWPAKQAVSLDASTTDDGHLSTLAVPFDFEVAHEGSYNEGGVEKAAYLFRVLGRRAGFSSTTVLQDVGEFLATAVDLLPELTGAESLELVSSSAQDDNTPGGTGTRTLRITYLDTSYHFQTVDYALNGTVAVPVAERMLFIYGMEALTGGSAEVSQGNIDLRIAGGGGVHERITAGGNRSLSGRFMVPDHFKAYVRGWSVGALGTTQDARLRATVTTTSRVLNSRYLFQDIMFVGSGSRGNAEVGYLALPARSKIKVSTISGAAPASNRIDTTIDILLIGE